MREKGFISIVGIVIIFFVALAALKYFLNWDIFDAAGSDQGQSTILYIRNIVNTIWSYIGAPVVFIWERVIWPIISLAWRNFEHFIEWGRNVYTPIT